jgi:hypothetical protein
MSMARTKKVVTKGMMRVNQGQCIATAITRAAVEIKNSNQYNPFDFLRTSIRKILAKIGYSKLFTHS